MPELPEVETVVCSLRNGGLTGETITDRQILSADLFNSATLVTGRDSLDLLPGKQIRTVERRAKYICISADELTVIVHLRMSGKMRVEKGEAELQKHDRFLIRFTDGDRLVFNDVRKFGRVWIVKDRESVLGGLGIEPLSDAFTGRWLAEHLSGHSQKIKPLLLDQSFIAGIGNIYADESLFDAKIHPCRAASSLSETECRRLVRSIRAVLRKAIEANGASFDAAYEGGHFQNDFRVYQQTGKPCPRCGTIIERITVGQRGTHFCPKCQKQEE